MESAEPQSVLLESLYEKFNLYHPEDFRGHSLSVSDIVALKANDVVSCHYVDTIGFKELTDFMKPENYLKNAEMSMEDDYEMIDGVINNGKGMDSLEKPSVLETERTVSHRRNQKAFQSTFGKRAGMMGFNGCMKMLILIYQTGTKKDFD